MEDLTLEHKLEGILFYKGAPVKKTELVKLFSCSIEDLEEAIITLGTRLQSGATRVIATQTEVQLVLEAGLDATIETIRRDELKRDIGKAGAETLAIVLYCGPVSRPEIDRIRGVNSAFILRNLLVRGLVDRVADGKTYQFDITPALLAHLGVTKREELPDHAVIRDQIETFEKEAELAAET